MYTKRLASLIILLGLPISSGAGGNQVAGTVADDVRPLIKDARELARNHGDQVWPGFSEAPFGVLLVDAEQETLFCHGRLPDGFDDLGTDRLLKCSASTRPATYPTGMFASFPAVDGVPTIVAGPPETTGKSPAAWVLTALHEHFHQQQYSHPQYYPGTLALGLDNGDETGMWMLNYPFPYENTATASAIRDMATALVVALDARNTDSFEEALRSYWRARIAAKQTVSDADWRYLELQLWKEGVARWTESAIASLSTDYADAAADADALVMRELHALDSANHRRAIVYPLGAGEAALLEAAKSDWRSKYWSEPFSLGPHFERLFNDGQVALRD